MTNIWNETFLREHELATALQRAGDLVKNELGDGLSATDIDFHQMRLMIVLARGLGRTPTELSRCLAVDPAIVTRALDKLERRKFVKRSQSAEDGRVIHVLLTAQGNKQLVALCEAEADVLEARFGRLSKDDADHLTGLLLKVLAH